MFLTIIFNEELDEGIYQILLDEAKQFRESLMHPSFFSTPEKFGGYDKLEKLYNFNIETISDLVQGVVEIIEMIESMKVKTAPMPIWLPEIKTAANNLFQWAAESRGH